MKGMSISDKRKKQIGAFGSILAIIMLTCCIAAVTSCTGGSTADGKSAPEPIEATEATDDEAQDAGEAEVEEEAAEAPSEETAETEVESGSQEADGEQPRSDEAPAERHSSAHAEQKAGGSAPAPQPSQPENPKKWVEDTQQVWVEDKAAWTEQVPRYETKEVSICNVCGADITGNTSAHGKAHMMAGEGSGHHSEVRREVVGYESINHPAEGHYETKVIGGHWG